MSADLFLCKKTLTYGKYYPEETVAPAGYAASWFEVTVDETGVSAKRISGNPRNV